jgi:catechol 2,3-dioxygenase-like lactoylglutathione lyase family enzyme
VITGVHALVFSEDAEAVRAFFRDVLGLDSVDAGGGWLIFALPPAELACHPTAPEDSGRHELFLMCDDIEATVADLETAGVEFVTPISDEAFGRMTRMRVSGGGELGLYQPTHPSPLSGE